MPESDALSRQRALIDRVAASLGSSCVRHETHISVVLVAGGLAWKFKKALRFDFLDFSTLDKRRFYCEEELRLNRMYAPELYLGVVAVTGDSVHPVLGGNGPPLDYAVKMRAFDQAALWSARIADGRLTVADIDTWATRLATLHEAAARAPAESPWCTPSALQAIADETLDLLSAHLPESAERHDARMLRDWEAQQRADLRAQFLARKAGGFIRECHGDLHCANILTVDGKVEAFDCIEFSESLRWIDVMNDIAFTCMDLRFRGSSHCASRLLNAWLEHTGDYAGLPVFAYYEVHRALIRCKVALLAAAQGEARARRDASDYLAFAVQRVKRPAPALVIMHGFSGSGKTTLARMAVEALDAIQIRADIERKRLAGIPALQRGGAALYAEEMTRRVYRHLLETARSIVRAGWTAVVDATFLQREQRSPFAALAEELGVRFIILSATATENEMRRRLMLRESAQADASDAGVAILDRQLACHDPFSSTEEPRVCAVDTTGMTADKLRSRLDTFLA
ncbi:AAA family ATPase [Noviherbaspirillum sp. ST9]|uniref:bifunctional aminoglycoside phosphotransferase/ATP-binding protein n=1 Tax=Noviherbaspirillum sp. ST9 TaxID=3401606 RepID=UPI003B587F6F